MSSAALFLPRPRWESGVLAASVALVGLLTLVLDTCWCVPEATLSRCVAVAVLGLLWAGELTRLRLPRALFAILTAIAVGWLVLTRNGSVSPLFLVLMAGWVGYTGNSRSALIALGVGALAVLGYAAYDSVDRWLPWIFGIAASSQFMHLVLVQQQLVERLRAAQADLARQAAAEERRRIAGEIHDVAAHSLAVTLLHLTGARMLVQRLDGDPRVVAALTEAERLGRQSLDDVRRTVGLLQDGTAALEPLPGAADVAALIEQYRAAGLVVVLERAGTASTEVPPSVGLALYRIVQAALANAAKHAPGAEVRVRLDCSGSVHLQVRNGPPRVPATRPTQPGTGLGLGGMRERATLLGGSLEAGSTADGGWLVDCTLPLPARTPSAATVQPGPQRI